MVATVHLTLNFVSLHLFPSSPVKGTLPTSGIVFDGTLPKARLGMAVLGLGDIDRDGFEG